jgi:hypothetical protein
MRTATRRVGGRSFDVFPSSGRQRTPGVYLGPDRVAVMDEEQMQRSILP